MEEKEQPQLEEREWTTDEIFFAMPMLKKAFWNMEDRIKRFRTQRGSSLNKEDLKQKRDLLLQTAKTLNGRELHIVYYIRHIDSLGVRKMLETLYEAEGKFKAEWNGESEWKDPLRVGIQEWLPVEI